MSEVQRYDIGADEFVPVTQAVWDLQERRLNDLAKLAVCPPAQRERRENWKPLAQAELRAKLKLYANPFHAGHSFIAEDREIEPYAGSVGLDGKPMYPTVPQQGLIFPHHLPNDLAAEIVKRWNAFESAADAD